MAKYSTKGTTISKGGSPVAQVSSVSGPNISRTTIDVTDLLDDWMSFVAAIPDGGEVVLGLIFDPAESTQTAFIDDLQDGSTDAYTITWPSSNTVDFDATVTGFGITAEAQGALLATATLKITRNIELDASS